jgi:hypothetical protein
MFAWAMAKKLVRIGNRLGIFRDKALLHATGIDADTPSKVSTDGHVITLSPTPPKRKARLRKVLRRAHVEFGGAFRRLAK